MYHHIYYDSSYRFLLTVPNVVFAIMGLFVECFQLKYRFSHTPFISTNNLLNQLQIFLIYIVFNFISSLLPSIARVFSSPKIKSYGVLLSIYFAKDNRDEKITQQLPSALLGT